MGYTTLTFMIFLTCVGTLYFIVPKRAQWFVLLTASAAFYIISCGSGVTFLAAGAAVFYLGALATDRMRQSSARRAKAVLTAAIIASLAILIATRYMSKPILDAGLMLPLGISYYTLMGISYMTDVYRGTVSAEKNPLMVLLFLCYFPHITEGPFDRYGALSAQLRAPHRFDYDRVKRGCLLMLWGLFKKLVIADRAALVVNTVFSAHEDYSGSTLMFAVVLYTLQIYAEFSGCIDIVTGASRVFGVDIAQNFRRPFFSRSVGEFWRRWHITLGAWLKDYVFYPVSLSRHFRSFSRSVRKHISSKHLAAMLPGAYALFFVWLCNGLWHGAGAKYIAYGLYYYALMMLGQAARPLSDRLLSRLSVSRASRGYHIFEVGRTCLLVCFGMLIFRSAGLHQAASIMTAIVSDPHVSGFASEIMSIKGIDIADYIVLLAASLLMVFISWKEEHGNDVVSLMTEHTLPVRWTAYMSLIFAVLVLGAYGGDFINAALIYGEF